MLNNMLCYSKLVLVHVDQKIMLNSEHLMQNYESANSNTYSMTYGGAVRCTPSISV